MPSEYPFKPPAFVMLSESGRFETGVKICLSISSFHPESWQPSWSVRSALVALIAFMQTPGNGAIGSLDHSPDIRREIAVSSRAAPPKHSGNAARQEVINQLHARMMELEEASKQLYRNNNKNNTHNDAQKEGEKGEAKGGEGSSTEQQQVLEAASEEPSSSPPQSLPPQSRLHTHDIRQGEYSLLNSPTNTNTPGSNPQDQQQQQSPPSSPQHDEDNNALVLHHHHHQLTGAGATSIEDKGLSYIAVLLIVGIVALLLRRLVLSCIPADWSDNTVFDFSASQLEDTEL